MLDGRPLVDVHLHPARLDGLKLPWSTWVPPKFDSPQLRGLYDGDAVDPQRFDELLAAEGVDVAVVLAEYSPKVTGWQTAQDMAALCTTSRVRFAANVALVSPHFMNPDATHSRDESGE